MHIHTYKVSVFKQKPLGVLRAEITSPEGSKIKGGEGQTQAFWFSHHLEAAGCNLNFHPSSRLWDLLGLLALPEASEELTEAVVQI